ncbi:MAG: FecR domain-containing protein [Opitutae bacterium]|nr:FecR domain-containing protein [Opitutae bacterium]
MNDGRPVSSSEERGGKNAKLHPLDWPEIAGAQLEVERAMRSGLSRRRIRTASFLIMAALCFVAVLWIHRPPEPVSTVPTIKIMAQEQLMDDGSLVELDETAEVEVDFTTETRRVLLKGGKAHFSVARNPSRPFIVIANGVEVRAVGTAFVVEAGGRTRVLVTEGRVSVTAKGTSPIEPVSLEKGQSITITHSAESVVLGEVRNVSPAEQNLEAVWRVPLIELDRTALARVLPVIEKYSRLRLLVEDPTILELKLSGSIRATNVSALLKILHSSYGIHARPQPDGSMLLTREK